MIVAQVAFHSELVNRCCIVHSYLRFLRVIPHAHADVVVAAVAPDVVRHLKADDEDTHVQLPGSFAQSMGSEEFVQPPHFGIIVRGVVQVLAFPFTHFELLVDLKLEETTYYWYL